MKCPKCKKEMEKKLDIPREIDGDYMPDYDTIYQCPKCKNIEVL